MSRTEQIKAAWESAFKNIVESIDTERTREEVACIFFELGCRWADENKPVDWQQVRIQAAIASMQGIISNEDFLQDIEKLSKDTASVRERTAIISVEYSNALVKELKGE